MNNVLIRDPVVEPVYRNEDRFHIVERIKSFFGLTAESLFFLILLIAYLIMTSSETKAGVVYYHPDHLGSASVLSDELGSIAGEIQYYPYGDTFSDTGSSLPHYTYTDQESDDETSLSYFGARYLDSGLGKFLSPDPLSDITYPQDLNPYQYARGNPMLFIDPDGSTERYSSVLRLSSAVRRGAVLDPKNNPIFVGKNPPYWQVTSVQDYAGPTIRVTLQHTKTGKKQDFFFNSNNKPTQTPRLSLRERFLVESMRISREALRRAKHYGEFQKHVDVSIAFVDEDGQEIPIDLEDTSMNNRMIQGLNVKILLLPISEEERFLFDQKPEVLEEYFEPIEPLRWADTQNHTEDELQRVFETDNTFGRIER